MCEELVGEVVDVLESFSGEDSLKELFWSILSYDRQRLPSPTDDLRGDVARALSLLELFALHDGIGVIHASCRAEPSRDQIESLCVKLEARYALVLLILHERGVDSWTVIYPDRTCKHHLRFLPIPGPACRLRQTARALAAMSVEDPLSGEASARRDVANRLDVFFPGAMPRQYWEFDSSRADCEGELPRNRWAAPLADYFYREISRFPLLTEEQERGEDLGEVDDSDEMNEYRWRLVVQNIRLVFRIASKVRLSRLSADDLVQEGILGLIRAAKKFDPTRKTRFATYASYWIRQSIGRAIDANHNLIHLPYYKLSELIPANRDGKASDRKPGERQVKLLPFTMLESYERIHYVEEHCCEKVERIEALLDCMDRHLKEREKRILQLRFGLDGRTGRTLQEIGDMEGKSRERIRQIQDRALEKLRRHLPDWLLDEFGAVNESEQKVKSSQ